MHNFHYIDPVITVTRLVVGCNYVFVSWRTINTEICTIHLSNVRLYNSGYSYRSTTTFNFTKFTGVPSDELLTVDLFVSPTNSITISGGDQVPAYSNTVRTDFMESMYIHIN